MNETIELTKEQKKRRKLLEARSEISENNKNIGRYEKEVEIRHVVKKNRSKKTKLQQIIGKKNFIDEDTGEVIETIIVEKNVKQDYNFFKVWLLDLLNILEVVGTKKMKVVNYIFENLNTQENLFIGTHEEISKKLGVSRPVVSQTFKLLVDAGLMVKKQNGVYMLNPDIVVKGKTGKRINLLVKYKDIENEYHKKNKNNEEE